MKVLVTGAAGMLARAVLPALAAAGHEVRPLARADADITRVESLLAPIRTFAPDWVFHLAGFPRVDDCESDPDLAFRVNASGARNAALAARAVGASLLSISTDYVFDGASRTPYREQDPANPLSVYGASKWAGEQGVREECPRHLIVRTGWLYGSGGTNFVDTIVRKARAGDSLAVVDDQRGSPTLTHDLASALVRLADSGRLGTFHVTGSGDCTWFDLAARVLERAGLAASLARTDSAAIARPAKRPAYSVLDNGAYRDATGDALPDWKDAVDRYLAMRPATV